MSCSSSKAIPPAVRRSRDGIRKHQAILPLKGKPMNPEKAKLADILKNEEYKAIIAAIGAGVGSEFELEESNYGKIIIMTDADTDGAHIQVSAADFLLPVHEAADRCGQGISSPSRRYTR